MAINLNHQADSISASGNSLTLNATSLSIPGMQSGATNGDVLTYNSTSGDIELAAPSSLFTSYAVLADVRTDGTDGGTSTIDTWLTRTINTEVADPDSIVTLSSNQFSLSAGSYLIKWTITVYASSFATSRLYDATNTTAIQNGITGQSGSADSFTSVGSARVTPTGTTAYEIQQITNVTKGTTGMGRANPATGAGEEVYAFVEIFKES